MVSRSFWRVGDHGFPPVRSLRIFDSIFFRISSCCLLISLYSASRFSLQPFCSALARIDLRRFGRLCDLGEKKVDVVLDNPGVKGF